MARGGAMVDFAVSFFAGALEGRPESLLAVALIALLLFRVVLAPSLFRAIVRGIVLATMAGATWLGYRHAQTAFSETIAIVVLAVGGLAILFVVALMASNSRQRGLGHDPHSSGRLVPGGQGMPARPHAGGPGPAVGTAGPGPTATPGHQQGGLLAQFRALDPSRENNIFSTVAFMFIAEFGVFSSVTINAKDPVVGAAFFVLFHLAAVLYIWTSYLDRVRGLRHYGVVAVASVVVSLVLYYTWTASPLPPGQLLPTAFFTESTMVASVTGVAFSLIISGKG